MTGALISADSPDWWQKAAHSGVNPPSKRYAALIAEKFLKGKSVVEGAGNPLSLGQAKRESKSAPRFDPMTSTVSTLDNVPPQPSRQEKLYSLELNQPAARQRDPTTFERSHSAVLEKEKRAFFRSKGFMESYLEDANTYRDFLVWQMAHPRGHTRGNNPSNFKPATDFYEHGTETTDTFRLSQSRLQVNRHLTSRNATAGASGTRSLKSSQSEPVLMKKFSDPPVSRIQLSPRSHRAQVAKSTLDDLSAFERRHHHLSGVEDMTKEELIELIKREGLKIPGPREYDAESNTLEIKRLKKKDYLKFIRKELFSTDEKPMVKKGKKLGKAFCVCSIFKSRQGSVRVSAYSTERSMNYSLFLSAEGLEDLDIRRVPAEPFVEKDPFAFRDFSKTDAEIKAEEDAEMADLNATYLAEWEVWGSELIERLELSPSGDLQVGPPRLMANGLSRNFCLTGRDLVSKEEAKKREPSRVHVRKWFDMK
ncbi:hypothetical protein TrCOL_g11623 [Triparma columacea]|uniref:Uncharacterized protein n=1 Tax=Triparma columacea TaxID=722753 RepID=A0A9W7LG87_9STRA|nr:hypothetical protein TrCOL_g11623 [Triparma columacea]